MNSANRQLLTVAGCLALLCGCGGGSDVPDLGEVSGVVTLSGQPLANGVVTFSPTGDGRPSSGETDADGNYVLKYSVNEEGAVLGEHKVTVSTISPSDSEGTDVKVVELPPAAADGSITKNVEPGSQTINIEL